VSDSPLDPAELAALQAAIRQSGPVRTAPSQQDDVETSPLALIAADRDAQTARPILMQLAQTVARGVERVIRSFIPAEFSADAVDAEVVDGAALKDEQRTMWIASTQPAGRAGQLLVAVTGSVIEAASTRRCGSKDEPPTGRNPSALALRLFRTTGTALVELVARSWRERHDEVLAAETLGLDTPHPMFEDGLLLGATIMLSGNVSGQIRLFARPETLLPPVVALAANRPDAATVATALGTVPIELRVELGAIRIRLSQLRRLAVGTTLTLPTFVDTPVPVYCGNVIKAWGKPVVSRGVLAVEVSSVPPARRGKP
jgi:flagellar motor switch/type III secretory pathway protein FliN